jgi:ribonuclease HI
MKINEYSRSIQIFTDASKKDDGRAGISFQIPSKNVDVQRRLSNNISIVSAEACAILEALKYIDGEGECGEVTIFSDSLEVVNTLEANTSKKSTHVIKEIRSIAYHMQQTGSVGVNIVWIPGHVDIRGNEQAHEAAHTATERNDIDIRQSITYDEVNTLIKRHINQLWQNQWSESEKGGEYRIIEPRTSRNIKLTCRNRKREVIMTRLRFGKSQLNYYMHIMRMHKDGTCDECKIPETIEHFLLNCTKNKLLTDELREICRGKNIQMTLGAILTDNVTLNTITDYIIKSKRRI